MTAVLMELILFSACFEATISTVLTIPGALVVEKTDINKAFVCFGIFYLQTEAMDEHLFVPADTEIADELATEPESAKPTFWIMLGKQIANDDKWVEINYNLTPEGIKFSTYTPRIDGSDSYVGANKKSNEYRFIKDQIHEQQSSQLAIESLEGPELVGNNNLFVVGNIENTEDEAIRVICVNKFYSLHWKKVMINDSPTGSLILKKFKETENEGLDDCGTVVLKDNNLNPITNELTKQITGYEALINVENFSRNSPNSIGKELNSSLQTEKKMLNLKVEQTGEGMLATIYSENTSAIVTMVSRQPWIIHMTRGEIISEFDTMFSKAAIQVGKKWLVSNLLYFQDFQKLVASSSASPTNPRPIRWHRCIDPEVSDKQDHWEITFKSKEVLNLKYPRETNEISKKTEDIFGRTGPSENTQLSQDDFLLVYPSSNSGVRQNSLENTADKNSKSLCSRQFCCAICFKAHSNDIGQRRECCNNNCKNCGCIIL